MPAPEPPTAHIPTPARASLEDRELQRLLEEGDVAEWQRLHKELELARPARPSLHWPDFWGGIAVGGFVVLALVIAGVDPLWVLVVGLFVCAFAGANSQ